MRFRQRKLRKLLSDIRTSRWFWNVVTGAQACALILIIFVPKPWNNALVLGIAAILLTGMVCSICQIPQKKSS